MEARVCDRLMIECVAQGHALCQQVRFPLLSICPKMSGRPHTICVDFVVVDGRGTWRAVDAKSKRVSRDWPLRAAAFEATYGRPIAEVEK